MDYIDISIIIILLIVIGVWIGVSCRKKNTVTLRSPISDGNYYYAATKGLNIFELDYEAQKMGPIFFHDKDMSTFYSSNDIGEDTTNDVWVVNTPGLYKMEIIQDVTLIANVVDDTIDTWVDLSLSPIIDGKTIYTQDVSNDSRSNVNLTIGVDPEVIKPTTHLPPDPKTLIGDSSSIEVTQVMTYVASFTKGQTIAVNYKPFMAKVCCKIQINNRSIQFTKLD